MNAVSGFVRDHQLSLPPRGVFQLGPLPPLIYLREGEWLVALGLFRGEPSPDGTSDDNGWRSFGWLSGSELSGARGNVPQPPAAGAVVCRVVYQRVGWHDVELKLRIDGVDEYKAGDLAGPLDGKCVGDLPAKRVADEYGRIDDSRSTEQVCQLAGHPTGRARNGGVVGREIVALTRSWAVVSKRGYRRIETP
jgi:hypothetical protein